LSYGVEGEIRGRLRRRREIQVRLGQSFMRM